MMCIQVHVTVSLYADLVILRFTICILGSILPLTIQSPDEFREGHSSNVTCTALYTCPKHVPTFRWNYGSIPASTDIIMIGNSQWKAVSTLTFTASANNNGKSLTCYAQFTGGQRQEVSITLRVSITSTCVFMEFP